MNFVKHSNLEGQHAFLGASTYHWINYTEEKVADAYAKYRAAQRGTVLHSFAAQCIKLGQRLRRPIGILTVSHSTGTSRAGGTMCTTGWTAAITMATA